MQKKNIIYVQYLITVQDCYQIYRWIIPMEENINNLMEEARSKTLCEDFDEQIEIAEELYGQQISLEFTKKDVKEILDMESYYPQEYKERVFEIIMNRRRKYRYLF